MITCIGITSIRNRDMGQGTRALTLPSPGVPGEGEEGSGCELEMGDAGGDSDGLWDCARGGDDSADYESEAGGAG